MPETIVQPPVPPSVDTVVDRIFSLKRQYQTIGDEINDLKRRISPEMQRIGVVSTPQGTIAYVNGSITKYVDRARLKSLLMSSLRLSDQMAEQLLNSGSAEKVVAAYVKVTMAS
jgi:hypothetical protein